MSTAQQEFDALNERWRQSGLDAPDSWRGLLKQIADEPDLAVELQQHGWSCEDVAKGLLSTFHLLGYEKRPSATPEGLVLLFDVVARIHDAHRKIARNQMRVYRRAVKKQRSPGAMPRRQAAGRSRAAAA